MSRTYVCTSKCSQSLSNFLNVILRTCCRVCPLIIKNKQLIFWDKNENWLLSISCFQTRFFCFCLACSTFKTTTRREWEYFLALPWGQEIHDHFSRSSKKKFKKSCKNLGKLSKKTRRYYGQADRRGWTPPTPPPPYSQCFMIFRGIFDLRLWLPITWN